MRINKTISDEKTNSPLFLCSAQALSRRVKEPRSPGQGLFFIFFLLFFSSVCFAQDYNDTQIVNAIYRAENSKTHPYGILAHYKHTTPRQACFNTVIHARKDWDGKGDFILFLQKRYCPIGASNDPTGLNANWYKNVMYFLREVR